jgi:hypothetical protein
MVVLDTLINDALLYQSNVVSVVEGNRGKEFSMKMCEPLVNFFQNLASAPDQENTVFELVEKAVKTHYEFLKDEKIHSQDSLVLEHMQTPVILELLYENDESFKDSVIRFVDLIEKKKSFLRTELENIYSGKYGLINSVDIRPTKGSTLYILKKIADSIEINHIHRDAILSSKSLGMNTSYFFGKMYMDNLGRGKELAFETELEALKRIFEEPVLAQTEISKNSEQYMKRFSEEIAEQVEACVRHNVSYANILSIPAFSVADIGSHICQEALDFFNDDYAFNILNSVNKFVGLNVRKSKCEAPTDILKHANISSSAFLFHIIKSSGFTIESVINFLKKINTNKAHALDLIRMLRKGSKSGNSGMPEIQIKHSMIKGLVDNLCLLQNEPLTTIVLINIAAENKEEPLYTLFNEA